MESKEILLIILAAITLYIAVYTIKKILLADKNGIISKKQKLFLIILTVIQPLLGLIVTRTYIKSEPL